MMRAADLLASALRAVRANPLRSALTALGVIIGVASVVTMMALGRAAQSKVEQSIASLGSNLIIVTPNAPRSGGMVRTREAFMSLRLGDAEAIAAQVENVAAVAPSQQNARQLVANGVNWSTRIEGVTPDYPFVRDWRLARGRFFDERDDRQARKVAVIGATVADELFPNVDPLGQFVRMRGGSFEVIGVLASKGQGGLGQDQDDVMLVPLTTSIRRLGGRSRSADAISLISVKATSEAAMSQVQQDIEDLLRVRHRLAKGSEDFAVQNLASITDTMQEATQSFTFLLAGIASISLLVGGIGIMNIMLVSVTERTREIGLRKALGARRIDILRQFGLEATMLSLAGGIAGLILGLIGAWTVTSMLKLPLTLALDTVVMALGFAATVGIVFGSYPAWRAARLDPIEALRRE